MRPLPALPGSWRPYLAVALLVGAASLVGTPFRGRVAPTNLVMLFLLAVVVAGLRWGRAAAVLASVLGVMAFDFFLVPPYLTFHVADAEYFITFAALLVVALAIGNLTGLLRDHAATLRRREEETAALYEFSQTMAAALDMTAVTQSLIGRIHQSTGHPVALLLRGQGGLQRFGNGGDVTVSESQVDAIQQLLDTVKTTHWTAPACAGLELVPLRTARGTVGVLVLPLLPSAVSPVNAAQRRLVEAFSSQAAVVIERLQLAEAARRAQLLEEAGKLHDALLHSISHALRTPLAAIIGSLTALTDAGHLPVDRVTRRDLLETAREEAERLDWLVRNLLDMTRLESGYLHVAPDWHDLEDVIGLALSQTARNLEGRSVQVHLSDNLPLVPLDQILIVQVLDNLLTNAAKYSPPDTAIDLAVSVQDGTLTVQAADRGSGIPEADLERVFEKFYRVDRPGQPSGTGLGLAICKGIVEAHHGRIWAEQRAGGGTVVTFTLPIQPVPGSGGADGL